MISTHADYLAKYSKLINDEQMFYTAKLMSTCGVVGSLNEDMHISVPAVIFSSLRKISTFK